MIDPKDVKLVPSETWLQRVAAEEDSVASISVGGLVNRLGIYPKVDESGTGIFGEFVKLIRRKEGLSVDQLALMARVDVEELKLVERGIVVQAELVMKLASALRLSPDKLAQLAGLAPSVDPDLQAAARRFESRLHSTTVLSPLEETALSEIMQSIGN
jgi:transcriptional regulator with XRE-family HTH domain